MGDVDALLCEKITTELLSIYMELKNYEERNLWKSAVVVLVRSSTATTAISGADEIVAAYRDRRMEEPKAACESEAGEGGE